MRTSLLPAMLGAAAGTWYAKQQLPERFHADQTLLAVYAAAGAAAAILVLRIATIGWLIIRELRSSKGPAPSSTDDEPGSTHVARPEE